MMPHNKLADLVAYYQGYFDISFLQAIIRIRTDLAMLVSEKHQDMEADR